MRKVYAECHKALKDGGVMAVILKDYVKGGKRVPLVDDTLTLLVSLGFELVERVRAYMMRHRPEARLFGGARIVSKGRKGFFRNLTEAKAAASVFWADVPDGDRRDWLERATRENAGKKAARVLGAAQMLAYKAADCPFIEISTRIDYEEVLFVRKGALFSKAQEVGRE